MPSATWRGGGIEPKEVRSRKGSRYLLTSRSSIDISLACDPKYQDTGNSFPMQGLGSRRLASYCCADYISGQLGVAHEVEGVLSG